MPISGLCFQAQTPQARAIPPTVVRAPEEAVKPQAVPWAYGKRIRTSEG